MKKIWSERDNRGHLCVDCSECTRGGNGSDKDKCCSGWRTKRGGQRSCFCGTLIPGINVPSQEEASCQEQH